MARVRTKVTRISKNRDEDSLNHTSPRHEARPRRLTSPKRISSFKENRERERLGKTRHMRPPDTKKSRGSVTG